MENKTRICPNCKSEIGADARFCTYCGAALINPETQSENSGYTYEAPPETFYVVNGEEPVSESELSLYMGKDFAAYKNTFKKLGVSRKVSFNWIVFVLTLCVGPLGAACWFFFKKCKKAGAWVLTLSLVLSLVLSVVSLVGMNPFFESFEKYFIAYEELIEEYGQDAADTALELDPTVPLPNPSELEQKALEANKELFNGMFAILPFLFVYIIIASALRIVLTVLLSLYANYFYKKDCIRKINAIKKVFMYNTHEIIASEGGNSIGWIFGCIGIYYAFSFLISSILSVYFFQFFSNIFSNTFLV